MAKHPHHREPLMPGESWQGEPRSYAPSQPPAGAATGPYARVAGGLHSYALGLTWRLALTVLVYLLLLFAVQARSMAMAKFVAVLLPLIGLATGLVMLIGLARFSGLPAGNPARPPAAFAAVVFAVAFCLELFGFVLVLQLMGVKPGDWSAMERVRDSAELADKISIWALALAFAHTLSLLVAFRQLARSVGNKQLAGQAISVGFTMLLAAGAVMALKWWLPEAEVEAGIAITLAITTLGLAIAAIAIYIRLANVVADNLLAAGESSSLPESRVVDPGS